MRLVDAYVALKRRGLFRGPVPDPPSFDAFPRRLWLYWDKGEAAAPPIVRLCLDRWRRTHPRWTVRILDDGTLGDHADLSDLDDLDLPIQKRANMLRLRLLARHGGVWADATTLCTAPLDAWLPLAMQSELFLFSRPGADRLVSTWFIAAHRSSQATARIAEAYGAHVHRHAVKGGEAFRRLPYFSFHYVIEHLVRTDPTVRSAFAAMPSLSAVPAHRLQRRLKRPRLGPARIARTLRDAPVHKLTWRREVDPARLAEIAARLGAS